MIGGISGWQLLILLLIVVLVFGTKKLRNIGSDLGGAVKGFRQGMEDPADEKDDAEAEKLEADPQASETPVNPAKDNDPARRPPGSNV